MLLTTTSEDLSKSQETNQFSKQTETEDDAVMMPDSPTNVEATQSPLSNLLSMAST